MQALQHPIFKFGGAFKSRVMNAVGGRLTNMLQQRHLREQRPIKKLVPSKTKLDELELASEDQDDGLLN